MDELERQSRENFERDHQVIPDPKSAAFRPRSLADQIAQWQGFLKIPPEPYTFHEYGQMYIGALRAALWPAAMVAAAHGGGQPYEYCALLERPAKVIHRGKGLKQILTGAIQNKRVPHVK